MTRSGELTVAGAQSVVGPVYTVQEFLRSCAFGDVFRARDETAGQEVTVTLLRMSPRCTDDGVSAIKSEVRRSAAVTHPGIVSPIDIDHRGRAVFYVTPFVAERTLEDLLEARTVVGVDRVLAMVSEVAAALDHAHEHGIVHRALVPSDITLDGQEHARVSNFGVLAALKETSELNRGHAASLVQAYAAPEYWRGHTVDGRADQYSLAVVAYELLAGVRRLDAVQVSGIQTLDPVEVSAFAPLRPGLGLHVNAALRTALSASPGNRFPTVAAFSEALAGRGANSIFVGSRVSQQQSSSRSRGLVVGTFAGLAVATGTVLVLPDARDAALGMLTSARLHGFPGLPRSGLSIDLPATELPAGGAAPRRALRLGGTEGALPDANPSAGTRLGGSGPAGGNGPSVGGASSGGQSGSASPGPGSRVADAPSAPTASTRDVDLPGVRRAAQAPIRPPAFNAGPEVGWMRNTVASMRALAGRAATSVGIAAPSVGLQPPAVSVPSSPVTLATGRATAASAPSTPKDVSSSRTTGDVSVAVRGGMAVVVIDGIPRGRAPLTAQLAAGRHTVSVQGTMRYEPASTVVTVGAGSSASAVFTPVP